MFENSPRLFLIDRLRRELLGPRHGLHETLDLQKDPRDEYVTGLLDVAFQDLSQEEQQLELLEATDNRDSEPLEEDEWDRDVTVLSDSIPACDPRREPSSMGLSWILRSPEQAPIQVACSLARYRKEEFGWQRLPQAHTFQFPVQTGTQLETLPDSADQLILRCRPRQPGVYQMSLLLVHRPSSSDSRRRSERLLFQPQLRVALSPGQQLIGLWEFEKSDSSPASEETRLRLLYRDQPVLARGHSCSAIWRAIDPEGQEDPSPWQWEDGQLLDPAQRELFLRPDLRTEYLPAVAVQSPQVDWRSQFGPEPERRAEALSQCWQPDELKKALQPLLEGYQAWQQALAQEASTLPVQYQAQAQLHLDQCRNSLQRMQTGLELLLQDSQARLAFCFAQRALWLQAHWKGWELTWRPFQLGFWLQTLAGLTLPEHPDRELCDLLWFPTGGGKTEAYLAIIAYLLGLRRLRYSHFDGTAIISRYTLRLLSIQQFRRAIGLITACEVLRVDKSSGPMGWRPEACPLPEDGLWGQHRFSTGLWVGYSVTPSRLRGNDYLHMQGALDLLESRRASSNKGEPAQVLDCPCCNAALAIPPDDNLADSEWEVHLRVKHLPEDRPKLADLSTHQLKVLQLDYHGQGSATLSFRLKGPRSMATLESWWAVVSQEWVPTLELECAQAGRPGYFFVSRNRKNIDFEIACPNPHCQLNCSGHWSEVRPAPTPADLKRCPSLRNCIPIPALTVDEQLYAHPPSLLLATADKFARLAFEPKASNFFGNFEYYHPYEGYYRRGCLRAGPAGEGSLDPAHAKLKVPVDWDPPPPELILQDELHLIDGPLGSMVGLYETVVEKLCTRPHRPKIVASTATVREAADQVRCLFDRGLCQFPAAGLRASDNFFALIPPPDLYQKEGSGRLYLGFMAPGRGSITPLVHGWAALLQALGEFAGDPQKLDPYWTPVGYFNNLNQLAQVAGLWRQFIPQRMKANLSAGASPRDLQPPIELSSRMESERLPVLLKSLETQGAGAAHGVLATSMFGTGVDVSRLSLMICHGQPKTTSAYIQATGRVGRQEPGLILTALSHTRPRELNHYEYFAAYHLQLYRGVEPVTVFPYAPRARERGLGPLAVAYLRQQPGLDPEWRYRKEGARKLDLQAHAGLVDLLVELFCQRAQSQPDLRRPDAQQVEAEVRQALQTWAEAAGKNAHDLQFEEYTLQNPAQKPVVLGDPQHLSGGLEVVYRNAPQSLREVEPTTGFKV